jgi:hypothetical protein
MDFCFPIFGLQPPTDTLKYIVQRLKPLINKDLMNIELTTYIADARPRFMRGCLLGFPQEFISPVSFTRRYILGDRVSGFSLRQLINNSQT